MSTDAAISVRHVSKTYRVFDSARGRLLNVVWPKRAAGGTEVHALRDVSFDVLKGESLGIIGRNGSGKSTLLEIITGTLQPTTGTVSHSGRVAALLELGSGFHPEYSGRDNVFLNALLMGQTRRDIEQRFDEIAAFADIGPVLDRPVKTYSSGMMVRLAFAVQVAFEPDILIVDEALSVGDYFFRQKCFGRMRELRDKGMTLLFVTHDINTLVNVCDRALYLNNGVVMAQGNPHQAVRAFLAQAESTPPSPPAPPPPNRAAREKAAVAVLGEEAAQWRSRSEVPATGGLVSVSVVNKAGGPVTSVCIQEAIRIRVCFVPDPERRAHVYVQLKSQFDDILLTTGTYFLNTSLAALQPGEAALVEFTLDMNLGGGGYSIVVMLAEPAPPNQLGRMIASSAPIGPLNVEHDYETQPAPFLGPVGLPVSVRVEQMNS